MTKSRVKQAAEEFIKSRIPVGYDKSVLGIFLPIYEQTWEAATRWLLEEAENMKVEIGYKTVSGMVLEPKEVSFQLQEYMRLSDLRKLFEEIK